MNQELENQYPLISGEWSIWVVYSICAQCMEKFHRNAWQLPLYVFIKT